MHIHLDKSGTVWGLKAGLEKISSVEQVQSLIVLAANNLAYLPDVIDNLLKKQTKPLIGGVFTAIIHEMEVIHEGVLIIGLEHTMKIGIIRNLSDYSVLLDEEVEEYIGSELESNSMFVFVDGYAKRIGDFIECLFNNFGLNISFIGGGAGVVNPKALEMGTQPCLFTNKGFIRDAAIIAFSKINIGIGVRHGWQKIDEPYKVTESDGNAIISINWEPAFKVYKKIIKSHSGQEITEDNFFEVAKSYPFGLNRMGAEIVVRDPFTSEGDSLIVATPVPKESYINVLNGNVESLIESANEALKVGINAFPDQQTQAVFLVDCVSRYLFFGKEFRRELEAVKMPGNKLFGVLSMGEIANVGNDYMEFFNKTCVVGVIPA